MAQHFIPGMDGDVYITPTNATSGATGAYVDSAGVFHVPSGAGTGAFDDAITPFGDRYPLTRAVLMITLAGGLYGAPDYRASQPTLLAGPGISGFSLAIVGEHAYIGSGAGVKQIVDPFGAVTETVVFAAVTPVGVIRADRQTHSHAAVLTFDGSSNVTGIGVFDGTSWATILLPPDADPAAIYDFVEVLVQA
jgi:hypothetical protein